jgi:hypothetical protein
MNSLMIMCVTAVLMASVAVACTVLCGMWSVPSWRRRLARSQEAPATGTVSTAGLTGWSARFSSALISLGIAACAAISWYGCWCVLTAIEGAL